MSIWHHVYDSAHFNARRSWHDEWEAQGLRIRGGLYEEILAGVARSPKSPLVFGSSSHPAKTTLGEIVAEGDRVAAGMHGLGLRAGDVLVFQMPNWRESLSTMIAALRLGVVLVPVVHIYGPAELGFILRETRAKALMLPSRWRKIDYSIRLAELGDTPDLEHVIVLGDEPMGRTTVSWRDLLNSEGDAPVHRSRPDDLSMMNFTSGTTAAPKGVLHSHASLAAEARGMWPGSVDGFEPSAGHLPLGTGPGGHIASIISALRPLIVGEGAICMDQFDGPLLMELLEQHDVRRYGGAPYTIAYLLENAPIEKIRRLAAMSSGGAGVPPALIHAADAHGIPMVRMYGSTEHPTITACAYDDPLEKRANTDGRLLAGCQFRIVDEEGHLLPPGSPGEIESIGPEMCLGYLDPALNTEAFAADGWFRTGDIGVVDADGFLAIVDRKKDIIIRGGENISSKEVEDTLASHPSVVEAAVVPWPDRIYGERVGAFVKLKSGAAIDIASIADHFAAAGLARQKTPERLVIVEEFPRTPFGKILKRDLRLQIPVEADHD